MSVGKTRDFKYGIKWNDRNVVEFLNNTGIITIICVFRGKSKIDHMGIDISWCCHWMPHSHWPQHNAIHK